MSDIKEYGGYYLEDLKVGMSAAVGKTITESDVYTFAGLSGDLNPVHINQEFASGTQFKDRIAHGMISAGLISAALGMKLPGTGTIWTKQSLKFKAPVYIGDTVQARVTIKEIIAERRRVMLDTTCVVGDKVVIEGEAEVMVERRPTG